MINLRDLPNFTFIAADGSEHTMRLRHQASRIRAVADTLLRRCPAGSAIGLMYPSGPDLVVNWLACLLAGLRPLILQYPNRRQNRSYWEASVRNTAELVDLKTLLTDAAQAGLAVAGCTTISQPALEEASSGGVFLDGGDIGEFEILQLSSGTTGFRKAVTFDSRALREHVTAFNRTLRLSNADLIVSWLPLYHDMGFIACFVMPLMLGVDVVMMDPVSWVGKPELLFESIDRHRASICYMPNFGFEVMGRAAARALPSMRLWISCSEPVSATTVRRFLGHVKAKPTCFAACYAMAENIFAVSISHGLRVTTIDGNEVVSCGRPISDVQVKTVDGEVWVRSPSSIERYLTGEDIRDADGFYPTGDLGQMINGELHIAGRRHDLLNQAGRKFILSDIDLQVNEIAPWVRGRVCAGAVKDERLQTEAAIVLIEAKDFFARTDAGEIAAALRATTGIDQLTVEFVPPSFLTKTTSGKINRKKSVADWQLAKKGRALQQGNPLADMQALFGNLPQDEPIPQVMDSLSVALLRMIAAECQIEIQPGDTLATLQERLVLASARQDEQPESTAIRIVSVGERLLFDGLTQEHLDRLSQRMGVEVTFEHVCVPASPVLLSDLIFSDWFQPRLDPAPFAAMDRIFAKLRGASVIVADDSAEMFYPPELVYGALSHRMERDPRSDLISVRWQPYVQMQDRLPITVVRGGDIPLDRASANISALAHYLGVPAFRIANFIGFGEFTEDWEWRPLRGNNLRFDPDVLVDALGDWLESLGSKVQPRTSRGKAKLDLSDVIHFCSHAVKQAPIDMLIDQFDRICVAGQSSSVPYIRKRLEALGKTYLNIPSYAPEIVKAAGDIDCILICGAMGDFPIEIPAVALQHVGLPWRTKNLERFGNKMAHLNVHGSMEDAPVSGDDWFYPEKLVWGQNRDEWVKVRVAASRGESA
jgi:acyl-CoA synthetase (AMP-forming)/AMP-acid ligase II